MADQGLQEQDEGPVEDDSEEIDPLDNLAVIVNEINGDEQGHRARVRRLAANTAKSVRNALAAVGQAPPEEREQRMLAALTEIGESAIIALEEQAETTLVLLGDLSESLVDVIEDLRSETNDAPEDGPDTIGIFAADSIEIRTLLQEYVLILRDIAAQDPSRAGICQEKIARIERISARVESMELPPDVTEFEDGGGEQT